MLWGSAWHRGEFYGLDYWSVTYGDGKMLQALLDEAEWHFFTILGKAV
jgi:hypothetical protein